MTSSHMTSSPTTKSLSNCYFLPLFWYHKWLKTPNLHIFIHYDVINHDVIKHDVIYNNNNLFDLSPRNAFVTARDGWRGAQPRVQRHFFFEMNEVNEKKKCRKGFWNLVMHTRKCPHCLILANLDKFLQLKSGQIGSNDFPEIWHGERSQLKLPPTYCWLSPPFAF